MRTSIDYTNLNAADLPASARELVDLIGTEKAFYLLASKRGTGIDVPKTIRGKGKKCVAANALVDLLGVQAASALIARYGGTILSIPSCSNAFRQARNRAIRKEFDVGIKTQSEPRLLNELPGCKFRPPSWPARSTSWAAP